MGFFSSKKGRRSPARPLKKSAGVSLLSDTMYDALFADKLHVFPGLAGHEALAWIFTGGTISSARINSIVNDPSIESRIRFLAASMAITAGVTPTDKVYLGTILEVPVQGGYDVLAFYSDLRARYYNFSNKAIIYEGRTIPDIDRAIASANTVSTAVCQVIGPWEDARKPRPTGGIARFTFLVSDGLYIGEGPLDALSRDKMGSALLSCGAGVMKELIRRR